MQKEDGKWKKEIRFRPAYDKRNADPKKNYGIGSLCLEFYLTGPKGTTQFTMSTGMDLELIRKERGERQYRSNYMAYDLGYHSPAPLYKEQTKMSEKGECEFLPNSECYYDGSTLNAEPIMETLIEEGEDAVWKKLEDYYKYTFEGSKELGE